MPTKLNYYLLLPAAVMFLASCSMTPATPIKMPTDAEVEQYNASVAPEKRIVCRDETPVGTNIPRRVCRRIADLESDSMLVRQELIRTIR